MKIKIDTKEKFHIITIEEVELSANMTDELTEKLHLYMGTAIKNVVLNMKIVSTLGESAADKLASLQQAFYDNNCSLVICELQKDVEQSLDDSGILELLNVTPTESEAGDIVNMEEMERELE